ncbi:DUF6709 family protein [Clostridium amazonitimonense]|uniref:DUF6709 family protein n=1 Tax=Clostridium amazonitimonense TaxID=1499689 RepID=UPI0005095FE5|nr:DUF6709 family protein [Clostridium amazonitimonense]
MKQSYFMKAYKKRWTSRIKSLILCALVVFGLIGMGIYTYYNNTNNATVVNNVEDYNKALKDDSYIQISSDMLYDLDIVITETRSKLGIKLSEKVKSRFVAINLPPFTLAVALPEDEYIKLMEQEKGPYILTGTLVELKDSELEILKTAIKDNHLLSGGFQLVPYLQYLNYEKPINSASVYFTFAGLFTIFVLALYIHGMRKNSMALKSLKNFYNGDIEVAYEEIDDELTSPDVYKNGPITITKNYIVVKTQQIVFALPLKELMWVYKETITKKVYFVIPAGKINSLVFVFSDKHVYKVDLFRGEKVIDEVIEYIFNNYANTSFVGYSEELQNLFKKDPEEFILNWKIHKEKENILTHS